MNDAELLKSLANNSNTMSVDDQNITMRNIFYSRLLLDMRFAAWGGMNSYRVFEDGALQYGLDDSTPTTKPKIIQMLKDDGFVVTEGKSY